MFSSGVGLFEALFPHNSTAFPEDAYGDASASNIEEYQQPVATTLSSDPNLEVHSFPPDHVSYYPSSESEEDFSHRFQIEDQYSQEFYDREEQSSQRYENWPVHQVLYHSNCWEEYYSSLGDNSEDTYVNTLQNLQDLCLGENGYASHYKDVENQDQFGFVLSGFESWFEDQYKEHHPNYDLQQPRNSVANLELCESLFGYWPCMSRNYHQLFCDSA